jgi:hypothetical protein
MAADFFSELSFKSFIPYWSISLKRKSFQVNILFFLNGSFFLTQLEWKIAILFSDLVAFFKLIICLFFSIMWTKCSIHCIKCCSLITTFSNNWGLTVINQKISQFRLELNIDFLSGWTIFSFLFLLDRFFISYIFKQFCPTNQEKQQLLHFNLGNVKFVLMFIQNEQGWLNEQCEVDI